MSAHLYTIEQKLKLIEDLIAWNRAENAVDQAILKSVAAEIRGRMAFAPGEALAAIENRIVGVNRRAGGTPEHDKALIGAGQELVRRWETIRQALEMFESHVAKEG